MSSKLSAIDGFTRAFGSRPRVVASAPGRVNLIGEHTDYNGGPVLPIALPERTTAAAGEAPPGVLEVVSSMDGTVRRLPADLAERTGTWADYVVGVYRELESLGAAPPGARLAVDSQVPVGAGVSSSAALAVSVTRALLALSGARAAPRDVAGVAYRAEHDFVGVRCGIMDQFAVTMARPGQALLIECATAKTRRLPFRGRLLLVDTGARHDLKAGQLNRRREECQEALEILRQEWGGGGGSLEWLADWPYERRGRLARLLPAPLARRARHVVEETWRTRQAVRALERSRLGAFGRLLFESHASCARLYECSAAELDLVVRTARRAGALGARLTGAGWGGVAMVLLGKREKGNAKRAVIEAAIRRAFLKRFGREPRMWETRAAGGARVERLT